MFRHASKHPIAVADMLAGMTPDSSDGTAAMSNAAMSNSDGADARRRWLTLTTLCLAVLVAKLDTGVVYLATRAIGDDLNAGSMRCNGSSTATTSSVPCCC